MNQLRDGSSLRHSARRSLFFPIMAHMRVRFVPVFLVALSYSVVCAQSGWTRVAAFVNQGPHVAVYCPIRQSMLLATINHGNRQTVRFEEFRAGFMSAPVDAQIPNGQLDDTQNGVSGSYGGYWDSVRQVFVVITGGYDGGNQAVQVFFEWSVGGAANVVMTTRFVSYIISCGFFDAVSQKSVLVLSRGEAFELGPNYAPLSVVPAVRPYQVRSPVNNGTLRSYAFDNQRRRLICLVGYPVPIIWEYDAPARTWLQGPACPTNFTLRDNATLVYDDVRRLTVIFGGYQTNTLGVYVPNTNPLNDTWHYDGFRVTQADPTISPAGRNSAVGAFDSASQRVWIAAGSQFGSAPNDRGLLDMWTYASPTSNADFTTYGSGCLGSFGTPGLAVGPGVVPRAGRDFALLVNRVPITSPVFVILGTSSASWNGLTLPFALTPFGAQGCSMLAGPDFVFPTTNVLGTAVWSIVFPNGLAGSTLFAQGVVFDPPANGMGVTVSDGGRIVIGF